MSNIFQYVLFFFMSFQESGRNHSAACGCGNTSPSTLDHKRSGHQHNVLTVHKFYLVLIKYTNKMYLQKHIEHWADLCSNFLHYGCICQWRRRLFREGSELDPVAKQKSLHWAIWKFYGTWVSVTDSQIGRKYVLPHSKSSIESIYKTPQWNLIILIPSCDF